MHLQFTKFSRGAKKEFFNRIAEWETVGMPPAVTPPLLPAMSY